MHLPMPCKHPVAMDPTFPLVPIANFLACILVLSSLSGRMFKSWNIGACSFGLWVAAESFVRAVNAIIWSDNVDNIAPYWCDIGEFGSALHILRTDSPNVFLKSHTR